jgi:hypothetical protein
MSKPFWVSSRAREDTHTSVRGFRPKRCLSYEHMFSSPNTPPLLHRLLEALRLVRSFLLLEDDYDVDWEVDWDEPDGSSPAYSAVRAPLPAYVEPPAYTTTSPALMCVGMARRESTQRVSRSRLQARRRGAIVPSEQVCMCPLPREPIRPRLPDASPTTTSRPNGTARV